MPNALLRVSCLAVLLLACVAPSNGSEERSDRMPDQGGGSGDAEEARGSVSKTRARVTRMIDGDTFQARVQGKSTTVRLIGIDAPELPHPPQAAECFAAEASGFVEARLSGRRIRLEYDSERIDTYGRTLAYAWLGRHLVNEDVVRMGYATVLIQHPNVAFVTRLVEAERKARRDGLGLWSACLRPVNTGADWRELSDVG